MGTETTRLEPEVALVDQKDLLEVLGSVVCLDFGPGH